MSTYVHDETSGYYYDASTTLYYDANSQYYFNSKTNQYMYWSGEHETFLPAPESSEGNKPDGDKKEDKKDKVKTAKRIAKDMEKWAKTLNQRKEAAKSNQVTANPPPPATGLTKINIGSNKNLAGSDQNIAGSEDIAFSMLNKRDGVGISNATSNGLPLTATSLEDEEPPPPGSRPHLDKSGHPSLAGLANYNSDSEEENSGVSRSGTNEESLTDWVKMACLLCQRQFPSKEKLTK